MLPHSRLFLSHLSLSPSLIIFTFASTPNMACPLPNSIKKKNTLVLRQLRQHAKPTSIWDLGGSSEFVPLPAL
ncbi:hypothetical protein GGI43DRAFT_391739 [Trichoderma evansii]